AEIFIGTVDGGVWRTTNFSTANPNATIWTPVTDHVNSLSIGSVAFSPVDVTGNTVFAGTAQFSSGGGPYNSGGLLRTTDGGATWALVGADTFSGQDIRVVLPTSLGSTVNNEVVLVGVESFFGLYRSTDGGQNFTLISGT